MINANANRVQPCAGQVLPFRRYLSKAAVYSLLLTTMFYASCKKDSQQSGDNGTLEKIAPDGFNFSTTKNVNLKLTLKSNSDQPLANVVVSVYASTDAAEPIFKGITNPNGVLDAVVTVPTSSTKLMINPAYVGLMHNAQAVIGNNNTVTAVIGGRDGYSGDIVPEEVVPTQTVTTIANRGTLGLNSTDYAYPTGYNGTNAFTGETKLGRPAYIERTVDVSSSLLSFINASLPENKPLTQTHPEYLERANIPDLKITAKSDVWITFVSEGAGNLNTLAYFTYPTRTPPTATSGGTNANGIDKVTVIFPNASAKGSGGGLLTGDRVKLGTFEAGISIGFVLISNGWTGTGVAPGNTKFYSITALNPEKDANLKKHSVLLYDDVNKLYLIGFEDLNRESGSDNDFNDVVVYATSNPVTGISNENVSDIDKGGDNDGDGVEDEMDAFPNDPTKAYVSYYPSQSGFASIAFEDNWPAKGDYDMNDMVINYRYTFALNAQAQLVDMKGEYAAVASGASFKNGFGVQLPLSASLVKSVTGYKTSGNYIQYASNGLEAGQSKAVFIPFDNQDAVLKYPDGSFFVNTQMNKVKATGETVTVNIVFTSPISIANLNISGINPFLISNQRRGYEIHLPGYAPTDKVDNRLFTTVDDASAPANGKYYISKENWPWAIAYTNAFSYPIEGQSIAQSYLFFSNWALSGGTQYTDWYSNTAAGYRDNTKIYTK